LKKVPGFTLTLGGSEFVMPRDSFIRSEEGGGDHCKLLLTSSDMDTSGSRSASGDFFGDSGSTNWLLGDQFLQNYYSIYDFDKKKIGLVEAK